MPACLAAALLSACGSSSSPPALLTGETHSAASAHAAVTVSPLAGTPDASPATQISFLGAPGTHVSDVRVVGSRSGAHAGRLRAYSTGTGESFLPAQSFLPGERVVVSARLGGALRGHVAGTSFQIAQPAAVSQSQFPREPGDARAVSHFASAAALSAPAVTISRRNGRRASPGYLFLAPYQGQGSHGPMIVDQRGNLVWLHPLPDGEDATNFGVQRYLGKEVLVWWQGRIVQVGFGEGEDQIYDSSYRPLATVKAGNGYSADLHTIRLTDKGTAWIDAFVPVRANLAPFHGSRNGVITDGVVQEIDIRSGLVMWEWHALGHIAPDESRTPVSSGRYPWDYAHLNAVDVGHSGDALITARNTWALYDVDLHSGRVRWRLGGAHSSFRLGPGARFYWQHDGQFQRGGLISLFDNGSEPPEERQSRGLLLRADTASHSATLVRQYSDPSNPLLSASQGNSQRLSDGNWLLGFGRLPSFTEFDPRGQVVFEGSMGRDVQDYTTFLARWRGRPLSRPSLALAGAGGAAIVVSASWNGATDVASWRVLAGASAGRLRAVASSPARGFETTMRMRSSAGPYVAVQAYDRAGALLGTSTTGRG